MAMGGIARRDSWAGSIAALFPSAFHGAPSFSRAFPSRPHASPTFADTLFDSREPGYAPNRIQQLPGCGREEIARNPIFLKLFNM